MWLKVGTSVMSGMVQINKYKCSLCRDRFLFVNDDEPFKSHYYFCPNCGADMRVKDTDEESCLTCIHYGEQYTPTGSFEYCERKQSFKGVELPKHKCDKYIRDKEIEIYD